MLWEIPILAGGVMSEEVMDGCTFSALKKKKIYFRGFLLKKA